MSQIVIHLIYRLIYHPVTTTIRRALVGCDGPPVFRFQAVNPLGRYRWCR